MIRLRKLPEVCGHSRSQHGSRPPFYNSVEPAERPVRSGEATIVGFDPGTYQTAVAGSNGGLTLERSCVVPSSSLESSGRDQSNGCHLADLTSPVEPFADGRFRFVSCDAAAVNVRQVSAAAERLARYAVSRVCPGTDGPLLGVIPLPSRASEFNRQFVEQSVNGLFDACLFVSSPVAIAYGLGHLQRTLVVDVGAGTVDISLIDEGLPGVLDQITLPVGLARTDRAFLERVRSQHGIELSLAECRQIRELHGAVCGTVSGAIVDGKDGGRYDVSLCLFEACRELMNSITTALRELALGGAAKPETVILAGGGSRLTGLTSVISGLIPECEMIVPRAPALTAATGALSLGRSLSMELWSRLESTVCDDPEKSARSVA